MSERNLMPSDSATNDDDSANETSEAATPATANAASEGRVTGMLAEAIVRFAEAQQQNLAVLQELSKSVTELKSSQHDQADNRRLRLELEALRREPKLPLGWLTTRLRMFARKSLRRSVYRKLDFQLQMERSFEELGIPETVGWVEDAVRSHEVSPDIAYSLLLPALVLRKELATAEVVAKRVRERYPNHVRLQAVVDKVSIGKAEPTPKVKGDSIVWRSRLGPRKHKLVLPQSRVGQAAWDRAKSLQGLRALPSALTALSVGSPKLVSLLGDFLSEIESNPSTWPRDLVDWAPDLIVVDYRAVTGTLDGENVALQQLAAACDSSAAMPLLWVDASSFPADGGSVPETVPPTMVTLVDAESTAQRLRAAGFDAAIHVIGPAADTRHRQLPACASQDTLIVWNASSNTDTPKLGEAVEDLPNWLLYDWGTDRLSTKPATQPLRTDAERAAAKGKKHAAAPRECIAIAGDLRQASHEQLVRLSQVLARGAALFVHDTTRPTLTGPWANAPFTAFDTPRDLSKIIAKLVEKPQAIARAQHLNARFAREQLGKRAAFARVLAHAGAPSVSRNARRVSVLCVSNRAERARHCLETYKAQTYPHKELIFVANLDVLEDNWVEQFIAESPDVTLLRTNAEYSLGESLNRARAVASGELWTKLDDDDHYGANYLRDLVSALDHSEAAVAGKGTFYAFDKGEDKLYLNQQAAENTITEHFICGGTILADRRFVENIEFQPVRHGTDSLFLQQCKLQGVRIYSADRYNYAYIRYPSPDHHTYAIKNESYLKSCSFVCNGFDGGIIDI